MKRSIILITIVTLFTTVFSTAAQPLMTNVDHRNTTSLNGQWKIIVDPYETGFYNYRYRETQNGYFKNAKVTNKSARVEYNFDTAETLKVPGDWNSQKEKLFFYEGNIWYRRLFDYNLKTGNRLFVYFGAVNYEAVVYLNGRKLGTHQGGFTPFNFEITQDVRPKDNYLIVKVDNTRIDTAIPTVISDWWNYGGITRRVMLIEESNTFIEDYFIQLKKDSTNTIAGWVQLNGAAQAHQVKIDIPEANVTQTVTTDEKGYAKIEFDADLKLWSPQSPTLYKVVISTAGQTLEDTIGFRSIQVKGEDILLNGQSIFLRGICIHEEAPLREGRAFTRDDARILLNWVKELNCNFVRLAHYPHNEYMTRLADEMGILVWSEIPLYWTISWENKDVYQNAVRQLTEMITRDKNKASIILWSVANETPVSDPRTEFLTNLTKVARRLDSTRLLTAAMERHTKGQTITIEDPLGQHLDVLGCNEYIGWYTGSNPEAFEKKWTSIYKKPLIMSELGGGALQGYHADSQTCWSEEFQENVYRRQIPMLNKIGFLRGISPWILRDFRSPRRPLTNIQDFYNRKGLISDRGEKKKAFFVLKDYYEQKAKAQ